LKFTSNAALHRRHAVDYLGMDEPVAPNLRHRTNAGVLAYVEKLSAHTDVASALIEALQPLGDVQLFCPDPTRCRYVVAASATVIFAFATGMNQLGFRLDALLRTRALLSGAAACPQCGEDWVCFTLFRDDWPAPDLPFWARKAYVFARQTL